MPINPHTWPYSATIAGGEGSLVPGSTMRARVPSGFIRNMEEYNMLIPGRHLQLLDAVGQGRGKLSNCPFIVVVLLFLLLLGEFGVVYRGQLTAWQGRTTAELVAVKTLKSELFKNRFSKSAKILG